MPTATAWTAMGVRQTSIPTPAIAEHVETAAPTHTAVPPARQEPAFRPVMQDGLTAMVTQPMVVKPTSTHSQTAEAAETSAA